MASRSPELVASAAVTLPEPVASAAATPPPEPAANAAAIPPPEADTDKLIDFQQIRNYLGFVARAVVRRRVMAGWIFGSMVTITTLAALQWPKSYHVDAKLLVQRNEVMSSLVNPGRTISREAESPTRAAQEIVLQHDNLLTIVTDTNLAAEWERVRSPLLKLKDWAFALVRGPMTDADRTDAMIGLLESRLEVFTTEEGAVTFSLWWRDPQLATEIVNRAIQNFLQFRRVRETSAITDSIAILDRSVQDLEAKVKQTISELPRRRTSSVVRQTAPAIVQAPPPAAPQASAPPPELAARLAKQKAALDGRLQDVARLENLRQQQLSEAQSRLSAAATIYTEGHPTISALRQTVAGLSRESPELAAARRDAQSLEASYDALNLVLQEASRAPAAPDVVAGGEVGAATGAISAARPEPAAITTDFASFAGNGEANDPTSLRLKVELTELAMIRERANAARAELSSSQAGFKYQYTVIRPPRVPKQPESPNVPAIIAAGVLAGLLLAVMAAVAGDLAGGRILDAWQVERQVGVPVALRLP